MACHATGGHPRPDFQLSPRAVLGNFYQRDITRVNVQRPVRAGSARAHMIQRTPDPCRSTVPAAPIVTRRCIIACLAHLHLLRKLPPKTTNSHASCPTLPLHGRHQCQVDSPQLVKYRHILSRARSCCTRVRAKSGRKRANWSSLALVSPDPQPCALSHTSSTAIWQ
jgi:hypothetical protein